MDYACCLCGFSCGDNYPCLDKWCVAFTFLCDNYPLSFVVPPSAYTIVTEATHTPNASLPALSLSGLVPSILQESSYSGSFSPQTLSTGQSIRPNGSIYSYNIVGAYNGFDTSQPVSSFSYYNNPLSDSCDVVSRPFDTYILLKSYLCILLLGLAPPSIHFGARRQALEHLSVLSLQASAH
jgi:hypothetical protein